MPRKKEKRGDGARRKEPERDGERESWRERWREKKRWSEWTWQRLNMMLVRRRDAVACRRGEIHEQHGTS